MSIVTQSNRLIDWLKRQIITDVKAIVRDGGVVVLVADDGAVAFLPVEAEVIDLGAAMVAAIQAECGRAGASWELVLATQTDPSAPNQDKLLILQGRAKAALFVALAAKPTGIVLTGLKPAQAWGLSEFELTAYLLTRTGRGLDRSNQNKFILAISPEPFANRLISSKELPDCWGGRRTAVVEEVEDWNRVQ
jgi:hypothetical protein